ncbi:MAG: hypothetical protein ACXW50_13955 [Candidatus Binatia bacterium]
MAEKLPSAGRSMVKALLTLIPRRCATLAFRSSGVVAVLIPAHADIILRHSGKGSAKLSAALTALRSAWTSRRSIA